MRDVHEPTESLPCQLGSRAGMLLGWVRRSDALLTWFVCLFVCWVTCVGVCVCAYGFCMSIYMHIKIYLSSWLREGVEGV
jgi:hypothetical protein